MLVKMLLYFLILLNSTLVEKPNLKTLVYKKKNPNEKQWKPQQTKKVFILKKRFKCLLT